MTAGAIPSARWSAPARRGVLGGMRSRSRIPDGYIRSGRGLKWRGRRVRRFFWARNLSCSVISPWSQRLGRGGQPGI